MKTPGTIEVSEADYRRQRKAYDAMLAALINCVRAMEIMDEENHEEWAAWADAKAAIKLAEGN